MDPRPPPCTRPAHDGGLQGRLHRTLDGAHSVQGTGYCTWLLLRDLWLPPHCGRFGWFGWFGGAVIAVMLAGTTISFPSI